jgi:chemotaxis protein MotB
MRVLFVFLVTTPLLLAGCANQKQLIAEQARAIDSLYVIERTIRTELYALQDSVLFYDEIDSGLYFRKQRALEDRINRLDYLLAVRQDTLCALQPVETLLVDDLFEPGGVTLTEGGHDALAALATHLDTTYTRHRFRVEGHSDNVPLSSRLQERYPSNWELSAARAAAVVRFFTEDLNFDAARFEVAALGASRPAASNTTARGRRQNRRIEILVLPE